VPTRVLRTSEVLATLGGISRWTLHRLIRRGDFPKPIWISAGIRGWHESDVEAWFATRSGVYDDGEN
jgi:predicted DNA-binding transcriptional regulator AlpA